MSLSLTPAKRQHSRKHENSNGKKFQKSASLNSPKQPRKTLSGGAILRVLCPSSRIESVIEKKSNILSQIRQETGAKVRIDDPVPGCDERVIFIMGLDKEDESSNQHKKIDNEDSKSSKEQGTSDDHNVNDVDKETPTNVDDLLSKKGTSSVQNALLLVFEIFFEGEGETEDTNEESNGSGTVTLRLLVLSSQVGCLLGMGGSIIKQMSAESGAQIRVLPRDKLPQCASSADEVVQITGLADAVKKALRTASDQILENASHDNGSSPSDSFKPTSQPHSNHVPRPESHSHRSLPSHGALGGGFRDGADFHSGGPQLFPKFHENFMPGRMDAPEIVTFRLLCPGERVGGVIGKGGAVIKTLQHEIGCEIKVLEGASDAEERMILVSGPAHPDDRISAVQDAVLRVLNRVAKAIPDSKEKSVMAKLLVPSNQIGCLLGKGGSIIGEMRKVTGAYIRILGKDQIPKSASENEEVVQINGELEVVQEALLQITTRLQHHFFRDAFPSINHPSNLAFSDRAPPFPSFMGRREVSPPGMFPKHGPSFRNADYIGLPPMHGGFHPHDEHPPFMHDIHRHGGPNISERSWHPQNLIDGPMGLLEHGGPPQRRMSGFGGGSPQPVITNTTVDVVVPSSLVPIIYGEDGGCLRQIRQISDAKITITDPKPGAPETVIIISGTPEQTHAAQSLIQAFVMLENESS
ncbi:KH domain-containing protein HEN4-like [Chenopodium quinoa]|uniref:K Homology domain-containing protein n=1 Tax=Chenopodium quinoa TaxID=63459 RepID=A0A803MV43_CHEQI|nr:KH domain-containing protein HEN4-like [Chenopodium quinoa]XP_021721204.1 KH domain-containing protein HEN4-like [Chenopodium quinoa]XP_021721205.1 KH domain-containing protein HEN4-like [Chenopodium quinoa]XP_021721206.1 KH domain-containing protein HEN4-like [Chenopodium quinoa]XP_021721207.1 KH domain-containing protein HEN4-like [Chenopodium quinoa]